jgi:hypothetical protein
MSAGKRALRRIAEQQAGTAGNCGFDASGNGRRAGVDDRPHIRVRIIGSLSLHQKDRFGKAVGDILGNGDPLDGGTALP